MGISIPAGFTIASFDIESVKRTLRRVRQKGNLGRAFYYLDFLDGDRSAAILLQELLDRGELALRSEEAGTKFDAELTRSGADLLASKTASRSPISEADIVLEKLLDRMAAFNADPDNPEFIDEAWLFGSAMRRDATVGDIDIGFSYSRRPGFKALEAFDKRVGERLRAQNAPSPRTFDPCFGERWLRDRALFGPRKHRLLAGVRSTTDWIIGLAVPCQKVFDRSRGGRVRDPIVAQHPKSDGRWETIYPPATLAPVPPPRPMDARWVCRFFENTPARLPKTRTPELQIERSALFPGPVADVFVVADAGELPDGHWRPRISRCQDGCRERAIFVGGDRGSGVAFSLNRSIQERDDVVELRVSLGDFVFQARQTPISKSGDLARFVALVVATDCERMARRELDGSNPRRVVLELDDTSVDNRFSAEVTRALSAFLEFGYVRLAPQESDFHVEVRIGQIRPMSPARSPHSTLTI